MNQGLKSARTLVRMYRRGILQITRDPLTGVMVCVVSKHNKARRLRFLARHKEA